MELPFLLFLGFVVIAAMFRVGAGNLDHRRIEEHLAQRGARDPRITWTPFGKGWFGDKSDRIYEVRYVDANGDTRVGTFKTSLLSGVFSTDDRVVESAPRQDAADEVGENDATDAVDLAAENARLRAELERVRRERLP